MHSYSQRCPVNLVKNETCITEQKCNLFWTNVLSNKIKAYKKCELFAVVT
jgi:hypothetical protein